LHETAPPASAILRSEGKPGVACNEKISEVTMNRMSIASILVVVLGVGCGGNEPQAKAPEPPPSPVSTTTQPAAPAAQETRREGESTLAASRANGGTEVNTAPSGGTVASSSNETTALTDDQILYVLHAANLAEMDQARMAQKKAKNMRVKRFAEMMLKDHGEADTKGNDVAKKIHASLAPSQTSNRLDAEAKQFTTNISVEKEKDFDRTYIDAQVKEHRAVLDAIDRELLPAVRGTEVKEFVQTVRAKVQGHMEEAEQIQKGLGK
jgi:putative membrane protein